MKECEPLILRTSVRNDVNHDLVVLLLGELKTGEKNNLLRVKQKSRIGLGERNSEW